jgi:hypothetical protein
VVLGQVRPEIISQRVHLWHCLGWLPTCTFLSFVCRTWRTDFIQYTDSLYCARFNTCKSLSFVIGMTWRLTLYNRHISLLIIEALFKTLSTRSLQRFQRAREASKYHSGIAGSVCQFVDLIGLLSFYLDGKLVCQKTTVLAVVPGMCCVSWVWKVANLW